MLRCLTIDLQRFINQNESLIRIANRNPLLLTNSRILQNLKEKTKFVQKP